MKKRNTFLLSILYLGSVLLGVVVFGVQSIHANHLVVNLGGFRCPIAPKQEEDMAIFKIIMPGGRLFPAEASEDEHFDGTKDQPKDSEGKFFCVPVPKGTKEINWMQLLQGRDAQGKRVMVDDWSDEDVRGQNRDKCASPNNWDSFESDHRPDTAFYKLEESRNVRCDGGEYYARIRYYFNDLDTAKDEFFIYFMKIADPGDVPLNNQGCLNKHGENKEACSADAECFWWPAIPRCMAKADRTNQCSKLDVETCKLAQHCKVKDNTCTDVIIDMGVAVDEYIAARYQKPDGYTGPLPDCAFTGSCRSIEDLLELGVKVADWLFSIIAGLAFVFFVYGGLTMVLSLGNAEKVGQGKQILVAATLGLIITFSAYILVGFVVKAIGINAGLTPFN